MPKTVPLSLYIPEPIARPGDPVDFRGMKVPPAGAALFVWAAELKRTDLKGPTTTS